MLLPSSSLQGGQYMTSLNIQEDYVIDEDKAYMRRKKSTKKKKGAQKAVCEEDKSLLPQDDDDEESYYYEYYDEGEEELGFDDVVERKNSFSNNGVHAVPERNTGADLSKIATKIRVKKKRTRSLK